MILRNEFEKLKQGVEEILRTLKMHEKDRFKNQDMGGKINPTERAPIQSSGIPE